MNKKLEGWAISIGMYPGVLLGARSYIEEYKSDHVLYLPFVDICLTMVYDNEGSE